MTMREFSLIKFEDPNGDMYLYIIPAVLWNEHVVPAMDRLRPFEDDDLNLCGSIYDGGELDTVEEFEKRVSVKSLNRDERDFLVKMLGFQEHQTSLPCVSAEGNKFIDTKYMVFNPYAAPELTDILDILDTENPREQPDDSDAPVGG